MGKELPNEALKPPEFAKSINVSWHRLVRAAYLLEPPIELVEGKIQPIDYPRLVSFLETDNVYNYHRLISEQNTPTFKSEK